MAMPSVVLEAPTEGAPANGVPGCGPSRSPEFRSHVRHLFAAASDEVFHDGMVSRFSERLTSLVRAEGQAAVEAIEEILDDPQPSPDVVGEAMRWLGRMTDPPTRSVRLWLLERGLSHSSPQVRDQAALGLASLGDPHAVPYLRRAMEREKISELQHDLGEILAELEERASCRT